MAHEGVNGLDDGDVLVPFNLVIRRDLVHGLNGVLHLFIDRRILTLEPFLVGLVQAVKGIPFLDKTVLMTGIDQVNEDSHQDDRDYNRIIVRIICLRRGKCRSALIRVSEQQGIGQQQKGRNNDVSGG